MNPLEQLKDIHLPPEVSNWPPAYGWWLLAVTCVIVLVVMLTWQVKRYQARKVKREALRELEAVDANTADWPLQLNSLLKRATLCYFPNKEIANLHSESWSNFLAEQLPLKKRPPFLQHFQLLQSVLYQRSPTSLPDFEQSKVHIKQWIKYSLPPNKQQLEKIRGNYV